MYSQSVRIVSHTVDRLGQDLRPTTKTKPVELLSRKQYQGYKKNDKRIRYYNRELLPSLPRSIPYKQLQTFLKKLIILNSVHISTISDLTGSTGSGDPLNRWFL